MHPRELGKYRILKLLPLGGMGRVYLALDVSSGQQVALKLIDQGTDPESAEIVEAERRGAILQARLCGVDPRVTLIRSYGELEGFFFIEMEYVEGEDLSEVLRRERLGVPFAARIGLDLCEVLAHAHNFTAHIEGQNYHGIVHGDIKPRNIRIQPDGQIKVLDFGIAKALSLTRKFTTNRFGSSQYSSPERIKTGEVDVASDLWSVGVVLFEVVAAHPYFVGDSAPKIENEIRAYQQSKPFPADLPKPFAAILRKALDPDESRRYRTANAFAADLRDFLAGRAVVAGSPADDEMPTRRSTPTQAGPSEDSEATRRTNPVGSRPTVAAQSPTAAKSPRKHTNVPVKMYLLLAACLLAVLFLTNEYSTWSKASSLEHDVVSQKLTDMSAALAQYQKISGKSLFIPLHWGSKRSIRERLIAGADRVINDYRNSDAPTVSEADWIRASAALVQALELDPNDREIRGKLSLAEGHIERIRGTARANAKLLGVARSKFESARELLPDAPDPYLGLARLYIYSLHDVERAEEALRNAKKEGFTLGRREKTQLADGYMDRAQQFTSEAARVVGLPEEEEYLKRAKKDFDRAEDLYREVVPFSRSADSLRRVREQVETIDTRLDTIREGV